MNLDELRTVQSKERQTDSLQQLRPSFYQEVAEYIQARKDEREAAAAAAEDPFSAPEVSRLTDEIETAQDVVKAIYERRMGKLVKQASLAAAGMPADDEGLTAEEADLFTDLVDRIESNKHRVLDVLEGTAETAAADGDVRDAETETGGETQTPADQPSERDGHPNDTSSDSPHSGATDPPIPPEPPADGDGVAESGVEPEPEPEPETSVTAADVMGGNPTPPEQEPEPESQPTTESTADPDDDSDVDRVTLRITQDIGDILGVDDREYTLEADDIVTLPEQNATPLVERDAAEPLE